MSIPYKNIQVQAALKSSQLIGTNAATLEASYIAAWTSAVLDGAEVPFSGFRDAVLAIEKELAHIIASDKQYPYRNSLAENSASLANKATIPTVSTTNKAFVGVFSGVFDSTTNNVLTEMPVQTLDDIALSGFSDITYYHYAIVGNKLRHTVTNAYFAGCVWDYTTQLAAYNANGNSPLPQVLENTWICGVLASLPQVGWVDGAGTFQNYAQMYQNGIQMLKTGDLSMPIIPNNQATSNPTAN